MLHLDLIRCFSSGGQARTIAKASLPFPSSGHSLLPPSPLFLWPFTPSPSPGEQPGQDLGVPLVPAVHQQLLGNAQPTLVLWEQGKELDTSLLYSPQGEGPFPGGTSPGGDKQELGSQENWAWLHVRGCSRAQECCMLLPRG